MNQQEIKSTISQMKQELAKHKQILQEKRQLDRPISSDAPFVISFVGRFKTGKSSLLNALLGADILPTKATTATSIVTRIFRGEETQAWFLVNGCDQPFVGKNALGIGLGSTKKYASYRKQPPGTLVPVTFTVHNATTQFGQNVFISGNHEFLGAWNTNEAVGPASCPSYPSWSITINLPVGETIQFKAIKRGVGDTVWESVDNRIYTVPAEGGFVSFEWSAIGETKLSPISLDAAKDIILNHHANDSEHPEEVILELPIPWLSNDVELRDTPGMDDSAQNGLLEKIAMNALEDTDLCVCVFDSSAMISTKERERTRSIHARMGGNVVYAVNCTNRLNSVKQLNDVEDICRSFFGALNTECPTVSGIGKYYLMCSAPQMIDLDGFDIWLKRIADSDRDGRNIIRKATAQGQLHVKAAEINALLSQQAVQLEVYRTDVERQQSNKRSDICSQVEKIHNAKETRVYSILHSISDSLCCLDGLDNRLKSCTTVDGWQGRYSNASKNAVNTFFYDNWMKAKNKGTESFFREINGRFIDEAMSVVTFPGSSTISVSATSGERVGGAAIGAGIGALFGPVGFLVGGFLGQAIGGSDTTRDNSVPNTIQFVRSQVVPSLRNALESTVRNKLKEERAAARKKSNTASTGLESLLADMLNLKRSMDHLIKETEKL